MEEPSKPSTPPIDRVTFPMDESGKPLYDRMRESTKAKLREWVEDPRIASTLGIKREPTPSVHLPDALLDSVIDVVGQLGAAAAIARYGATNEQASLMRYDAGEKAILREPLERVLNKYGGDYLGKYADEIALASALITTTARKLQAVQQATRQSATVLNMVPKPEPEIESTVTD